MDIYRSIGGDLAGQVPVEVGMVVTVDAYESTDDDLRDYMEERDNGYGEVVESFDDESRLIWVKECPYAIECSIVWRDLSIRIKPNNREEYIDGKGNPA